jgi:hypothetical protein
MKRNMIGIVSRALSHRVASRLSSTPDPGDTAARHDDADRRPKHQNRVAAAFRRILVLTIAGSTIGVTLAPTPAHAVGVQSLGATADAGVYSGAQASNYGTSTTARVDHSATADRPWYLRFPAPTVPVGEHITGARLRYYTAALPTGYTSGPAVTVVDTSNTWSESTLTYANRPAPGLKITGSAAAGAVGAYNEVPLQGYTGGSISLLVRAADAGSAHIYSREDPSGRGPTLVVTTALNAVQPNLAPASGTWLGWYLSGNADPRSKEASYGRKTDAFRRYYSVSDLGSWPTDADVTVAKADGGRRVLFASVSNRCYSTCPTSVNGKSLPAPGLVVKQGNPDFDGSYFTPEQISSGALDPLIDAEAARIKATGLPFVLDLMHEVDTTTEKMDDITPQAKYGGMTLRDWWETTFPAAFQHWENRLKAQGVTTVTFAIDYAGFRADSTAYTRTYPGDAYVSWIAWDPYDFKCTKGGAYNTWSSFYNRLEAGLLGSGAKTKSYGLLETGVGPGTAGSACRVTWVNGMAEGAQKLPKIKTVLYFNRASADYNLDSDTAVQSAWVSEIKSPYLNQPHA